MGLYRIIKNAKDFGGPEKFVEFIENSSRQKGRGDMLPWIRLQH